MKKVPGPQVVTASDARESPLPAEIQEALGEMVGGAREGLLALHVGAGLRVVHELMEAEVTEIVGTSGKHNPERPQPARPRGRIDDVGGRRVAVSRPRARSVDGREGRPHEPVEQTAKSTRKSTVSEMSIRRPAPRSHS
jgi:hypothetical protein